ncbi:MAG: hypothetical protein WCY38_06490 [Endomicrobiia bacterium]
MYSTKLFFALEAQQLEKDINQFLWTNHREIEEVVGINVNDTKNNYIACLLYKKHNNV